MSSWFIGLIGCGNLGSIIIERLLKADIRKENIKIFDKDYKKVRALGFEPCNLIDLFNADILFLAVKPFQAKEVLKDLKIKEGAVLLSTMAGVEIEKIQNLITTDKEKERAICRLMPNIGIKLGLASIAITYNEHVNEAQKIKIKEILENFGSIIEIPEKDFDAFTALVGSGPAFVSSILEAFTLGGIACGLNKDDSQKLTLETFNASIELIKSGLNFDDLRFLVSSPAGTTIAGLEVLEKNAIRGDIIECLIKACKRSKELK